MVPYSLVGSDKTNLLHHRDADNLEIASVRNYFFKGLASYITRGGMERRMVVPGRELHFGPYGSENPAGDFLITRVRNPFLFFLQGKEVLVKSPYTHPLEFYTSEGHILGLIRSLERGYLDGLSSVSDLDTSEGLKVEHVDPRSLRCGPSMSLS